MVAAIHCYNLVVVAPVVVTTLKYAVKDGVHEVEEHIGDIPNCEDDDSHHRALPEIIYMPSAWWFAECIPSGTQQIVSLPSAHR